MGFTDHQDIILTPLTSFLPGQNQREAVFVYCCGQLSKLQWNQNRYFSHLGVVDQQMNDYVKGDFRQGLYFTEKGLFRKQQRFSLLSFLCKQVYTLRESLCA